MSLRLLYTSPPVGAALAADADQAVYALGAAGATAVVALGDRYRLPLDGVAGLAELRLQVQRLLEVLRTGHGAPGDDTLRAELPDVPISAVLHSWHFPSYMVDMPVIVLAIDVLYTRVYTRTLSQDGDGHLIVAEERDLADAVVVPTAELRDTAQAFLDEVDRDAAAITEGSLPGDRG